MIGANARIMDTDFHPIDPKTRRFGTQDVQTAPIVIGSNVLLGANSLVLKGVTIGDNVIIGAGSVIGGNVWLTHAVPPGSIVTHEGAVQRSREAGETLLEYYI